MRDGLSVLDANGVHIMVNDAFCRMTGFSREELIGRGLPHPYWPPEELEKIEESYSKTTESNFNDFEFTFMRKNGERFPVIVSPSAIMDRAGNVIAYATVKDITERKKAEEVLRASEKKYRTLLENLPEKIFLKDKDSVYISCNENYAADLKIKAEEIAGKTDYDFHPKELAEKYRADDIRIMKSGKTEYVNKKYIQNGLELIIHAAKTPVRDKEGNVTGILGVFRDITAQRQAQNKVLAYQKQLRDLASEMSLIEERQSKHIAAELHDRIAQNLILFKINLGHLRETDLPASLVEPLDEIYKYLDRIINDVRSLTSDLASPALHELGLEAAIREWLDEEVRQKYGIKTEFEDDAQLKPLDEDVGALLYRAVRELLINIIKHAKARQVKVSIHKEKNKIRINVLDDGIGFIYPIENVASNKARGFGLFSIRERLNCLGGSLEIDSKPRHGTRVTLVAPIKSEKTH
jgi:PAS domain S-box-containing protein